MKFFYTKDYPHQWTSGSMIISWNDEHRDIASLEEARELALKHAIGGYHENRCVTTYGVRYAMEEEIN